MPIQRIVITEADLSNAGGGVFKLFSALAENQRPKSDATLQRIEVILNNAPVGGLTVSLEIEYDRGSGTWTMVHAQPNIDLSASNVWVFNNLGAPFALSQLGDNVPNFGKLRYHATTNNAQGYSFTFILYFEG